MSRPEPKSPRKRKSQSVTIQAAYIQAVFGVVGAFLFGVVLEYIKGQVGILVVGATLATLLLGILTFFLYVRFGVRRAAISVASMVVLGSAGFLVVSIPQLPDIRVPQATSVPGRSAQVAANSGPTSVAILPSTSIAAPTVTPVVVHAATPVVSARQSSASTPAPKPNSRLLAEWGSGPAHDIVLTQDGRRLFVASSRAVHVYDSDTFARAKVIGLETDSVGSLGVIVVSGDGKTLVGTLGPHVVDNQVRVWDVHGGMLTHVLSGHTKTVRVLAYSPREDLVASGSDDGEIRLWDTSNGTLVRVLTGHSASVTGLAFSADGRLLGSASEDRTARLWSMTDGLPLGVFEGHRKSVFGIAFSPDGQVVASASDDGSVRFWGVQTQKQQFEIPDVHATGGFRGSKALRFAPDGKSLATMSKSGVILWDAQNGRPLKSFVGPEHAMAIYFSDDGSRLIARFHDSNVRMWRVSDATPLPALPEYGVLSSGLKFSSDGSLLASGEPGAINIRRVNDGRVVLRIPVESHPGAMAWSNDGRYLAAFTGNRTEVRVWNRVTGEQRHALLAPIDPAVRELRYAPDTLTFSPDGSRIASTGVNTSIHIWLVADGRLERTLIGHTDTINDLAFSPDGATLASASSDGTVRMWHVSDGSLQHSLHGHDQATAVVFSPDGSLVATGPYDRDGDVRLWHALDGTPIRQFPKSPTTGGGLRFAADGQILVASDKSPHARLWNVANGALVASLDTIGGNPGASGIALSPDGTLLAAAHGDEVLRVWTLLNP